MKYFYIVYTAEQDKHCVNPFTGERSGPDYAPGLYASVLRVSAQDNLLSVLNMYEGIKHANICTTKREADTIAAAWNDSYKRNGTYLFA